MYQYLNNKLIPLGNYSRLCVLEHMAILEGFRNICSVFARTSRHVYLIANKLLSVVRYTLWKDHHTYILAQNFIVNIFFYQTYDFPSIVSELRNTIETQVNEFKTQIEAKCNLQWAYHSARYARKMTTSYVVVRIASVFPLLPERTRRQGVAEEITKAARKRRNDTWSSHQHWDTIVVSTNRRSVSMVDWSIVA